MRFPLREEAEYIAVRRGAALLLLGEKWLLHRKRRVRSRLQLVDRIDRPSRLGESHISGDLGDVLPIRRQLGDPNVDQVT